MTDNPSVENYLSVFDIHFCLRQSISYRLFISEIHVHLKELKAESPVHGPRVYILYVKLFGYCFGYGGFSRSARSVDRYLKYFFHSCLFPISFPSAKAWKIFSAL